MSMVDQWTDGQIEEAIRLLVCAEKLIEPFRDMEGDWGKVYLEINTFLTEAV